MKRRQETALAFFDGRPEIGKEIIIDAGHVELAHRTGRGVVIGQPTGIFQRTGFQVTVDDLVHDTGITQLGGLDRLTLDDHLQGRLGADQARQALGSAGAR